MQADGSLGRMASHQAEPSQTEVGQSRASRLEQRFGHMSQHVVFGHVTIEPPNSMHRRLPLSGALAWTPRWYFQNIQPGRKAAFTPGSPCCSRAPLERLAVV